MVYRIFVEKKPELANEAAALKNELSTLLGIRNLESVRIINRYDVENIEEELFSYAKKTVFSEPQLDIIYDSVEAEAGERIFAIEALPGQFDQRAASAAECIQLISQKERPTVKTAKVYILKGDLSAEDFAAVKTYLINPVESREASLSLPACWREKHHTAIATTMLNSRRLHGVESLNIKSSQRVALHFVQFGTHLHSI